MEMPRKQMLGKKKKSSGTKQREAHGMKGQASVEKWARTTRGTSATPSRLNDELLSHLTEAPTRFWKCSTGL